MTTNQTQIIIVGAGPTGLLLAGDLASAGVSVRLLEKRTHESNLTRAFAVHAGTLEALDIRGLADDLVEAGSPQSQLQLFGRTIITLSDLDTRFPFVLVAPQYATERVLHDRAVAAGAIIERGAEVVGVAQDDTGVDVHTRDASYRAEYLVGTDGVRSAVREALGLPFPGKLVVGSLILADVRLDRDPDTSLRFTTNAAGFTAIVPFSQDKDTYWRVICRRAADRTPEDQPVGLDEVRAVFQEVNGTDYHMRDLRWSSRIHSDERQAPQYRVGRVFLAGDAAHVHSPAGGQGMNTSIQDGANLSWKLAAAVQGWAPDGLLDSYQAERHPVGRQVLRGSGFLLRLLLLGKGVVGQARLRLATSLLGVDLVRRRAANLVSGLAVRYRTPRDAEPGMGTRARDIALAREPGRLFAAIKPGRFTLVTTEPDPQLPPPLAGHTDVVAPAEDTGVATLVRPDGYIAWTGPHGTVPRWRYATA